MAELCAAKVSKAIRFLTRGVTSICITNEKVFESTSKTCHLLYGFKRGLKNRRKCMTTERKDEVKYRFLQSGPREGFPSVF